MSITAAFQVGMCCGRSAPATRQSGVATPIHLDAPYPFCSMTVRILLKRRASNSFISSTPNSHDVLVVPTPCAQPVADMAITINKQHCSL